MIFIMDRRKVTFKRYPNAREAERLTAWVRLHCERYKAAIQKRIEAYRKAARSIIDYDQQNLLPEIKAARPEFVELGRHVLQQTLRRLDRAFHAFFRRARSTSVTRETPRCDDARSIVVGEFIRVPER